MEKTMKSQYHSNTMINEKGFTIIEVMIVIGIFAIGILSVASMQVSAFQGNRSATLRTRAITLASEQMENLISQNYGTIAGSTNPITVDHFDISWVVTNSTSLSPATKTIVVTVTWTDRGEIRNVNLNHIIAKLN
jgi:prepilin-type N-terminal cleavage/methylation domain-containing protein